MGAVFEPGYIVVDEDGVRHGSTGEDVPLPVPGDILVLRHPDESGPTWQVVRREFVNAQQVLVVVREVDAAESAAARITDWG